MKHIILLIFLSIGFRLSSSSQILVELTASNAHVDSGHYHFDIYLNTAPGPSTNLYLAGSDFRLFFTDQNFLNPAFSQVDGYCSLEPSSPGSGGINTLITQANYSNSIATEIQYTHELVINLGGPSPGSMNAFNNAVAKIDNQMNTHRLGRFKISGYQGGVVNLMWKLTGLLHTKVYTMAPDPTGPPPFETSITQISSPALPVNWLGLDAELTTDQNVLLYWETAWERHTDRFEIHRKSEGEALFSKIGKLEAAGFSDYTLRYQWLDAQWPGTSATYRIKQIDINGAASFSPLVEVNLNNWQRRLLVFPNPTHAMVTFQNRDIQVGKLELLVYDLLGREIHQEMLETSLASQVTCTLGHLPAGQYQIQLKQGLQLWKGTVLKVSE